MKEEMKRSAEISDLEDRYRISNIQTIGVLKEN